MSGSNPTIAHITLKNSYSLNTYINLEEDNESIYIKVNDKSDILHIFFTIKKLVTWYEYSPISLYSIYNKNGIISKKKKNISMFRYSSIYDLLDMSASTKSTLFTNSGDSELNKINEWEIRYIIKIPEIEFEDKINNISREFGIKMETLIKEDD